MADTQRDHLVVVPLSDGAPAVGRALWALEDARRRTESVVATIDLPLVDLLLHPKANSVGSLLYHIAAIEADWLYAEILEGRSFPDEILALFPHDVRDQSGRLSHVAGVSVEQHLQRLSTVRAHLRATLELMSLEEFRRPRRLEKYEVTPEWVLHHLMQHEAQHRGQIQAMCDLAGARFDAMGS